MTLNNPAVRRGVFDGLIVAALIAVTLFLSNVVFPAGPDESDDDPEYLIQIAIAYVLIAAVFVLIGLRARRRLDQNWAGAAGGAAAGFVIALGLLVAVLVIDNAFLSTVSQQHDKRVAFATSGFSSMRTFLTVRTLLAALTVVPGVTVVGGLLGMLGGAIARPRHAHPVG
jgi:uncharacterized membrane protein YozB (DUF420 family)